MTPPPLPPPPPTRRSRAWAIVAGAVVVAVIALTAVAIGVGRYTSAASSSPSATASSGLPATLGGLPRVTAGGVLQRIQSDAPVLPVAGASYDLAMYGDASDPASMLMVIHGLGATVDALPKDVFFSTVGNGLATGVAQSGLAGGSVDFAHGVETSASGADHDCVPLRRGGTAEGVICVFRASGTIGMVVLFDQSDPHAAVKVSEEAATAVT